MYLIKPLVASSSASASVGSSSLAGFRDRARCWPRLLGNLSSCESLKCRLHLDMLSKEVEQYRHWNLLLLLGPAAAAWWHSWWLLKLDLW